MEDDGDQVQTKHLPLTTFAFTFTFCAVFKQYENGATQPPSSFVCFQDNGYARHLMSSNTTLGIALVTGKFTQRNHAKESSIAPYTCDCSSKKNARLTS